MHRDLSAGSIAGGIYGQSKKLFGKDENRRERKGKMKSFPVAIKGGRSDKVHS